MIDNKETTRTTQQTAARCHQVQHSISSNITCCPPSPQQSFFHLHKEDRKLVEGVYGVFIDYRRFNDAADMSKEELERHHLYTEVLEYEKTRVSVLINYDV